MTDRSRKILKPTGAALLFGLLITVIAYWDLLSYATQQGYGQLSIVWRAKPVEHYLKDPDFPDSLKLRLKLIDEVRKYAIDSLGLEDTQNYRTLYDQQGKEIMWVVMACEPFRLKPKEWKFPIVGAVPYKGFFDKEKAYALKTELENDKWDVIVRNPGGWSTLGWFTDPILSKMLSRSEGDLVNLIIHEMSHATIFVKDSVDFNENLATFIGDRGAEKYLIDRYGLSSREYTTYMKEDEDYLKYVEHMLRGAHFLDSIYTTMEEHDPIEQKVSLKEDAIRTVILSLDTLSLSLTSKPSKRFKELPNNAYFMNYRQYQSKQNLFLDEWNTKFNSDLKAFVVYMSEKYPFL
jgi:predicted aminopeptidase